MRMNTMLSKLMERYLKGTCKISRKVLCSCVTYSPCARLDLYRSYNICRREGHRYIDVGFSEGLGSRTM